MNYKLNPQAGVGEFVVIGGETPTEMREYSLNTSMRVQWHWCRIEPKLYDDERCEYRVDGGIYICKGPSSRGDSELLDDASPWRFSNRHSGEI